VLVVLSFSPIPHSGVPRLLSSLFSCLSKIDLPRRQVALGLFAIALHGAEGRQSHALFDHPFKVTLGSLRKFLRGRSGQLPEDALEDIRFQMPRLPFRSGRLSSADSAGLPLFDIIRTLQHRGGETHTVWWVRPGQWSHFGLSEAERLFVCRLMAAWSISDDVKVGSEICKLGAAMSRLEGGKGLISDKSTILERLLKGFDKRQSQLSHEEILRNFPAHVFTALKLMEEVGVIDCGENQLDMVCYLEMDTEPNHRSDDPELKDKFPVAKH
jgi:hypothetical protein